VVAENVRVATKHKEREIFNDFNSLTLALRLPERWRDRLARLIVKDLALRDVVPEIGAALAFPGV
jgi:hypothetical protein